MQAPTLMNIAFLLTVAGVSAFAFIHLHARVRIKYESRMAIGVMLFCSFLVFMTSTLLFLIFGIIFISEINLSVYIAGMLLLLCSIIFLLAANIITSEREYFRQLEKRQTEHDSSTGLPKYPIFLQKTKRALSKHSLDSPYFPAVLVILISGLRQLDRRVGFGVSDYVIRTVAQRIHATLRTTDYISRLNENLFAVYVNDLKERENVHIICENILKSIKVPVQVATAEQAPIFPYIGVAFYKDHPFDDVLKYAQAAALEACDRGMEVIVADYITPVQKADSDLLTVLQRGLEEKSFQLYYQPQVALHNLEVIGVESLIRLPQEDWLSIGPGELVELAERNGMIHQLDLLVFQMLFEQVDAWVQKELKIRVAVNMSIKSFKNHSLLDYIVDTLEKNPRYGKRLKIEITETASLDDVKEMVEFMKQVSPLGVLFCIDDFGTQYSSMEYMQRLPVHEVKIDKSFVLSALSDDASEKIVRSVIQLAHSLNLSVTAEGVENEQMLNFLRSWKCDQAQGFYFSQALSAEEFEDYLAEQKNKKVPA